MNTRAAIVNADDFGQSLGVNRGVAEAYERGILTSTSLMVRWPAAEDAAAYARCHPKLGVGLHLDLGEWALDNGNWLPRYEVVDIFDSRAIASEITQQLETFETQVGQPPAQIDSHQHVHRREPVRSILCEIAERRRIPVREASVPYCGKFYGCDENAISHPEWIGVRALIDIFGSLNADVTEIACHPAAVDDLNTMYRAERLRELETLCDPRLREAISELGIRLISFADWQEMQK